MAQVSWKMDDDTWVSPAMHRTLSIMRDQDLTITGFRDGRGRLRFILSNNQIVHSQTVDAMKRRGLLEQMESDEEATAKNEVHYRLKLK